MSFLVESVKTSFPVFSSEIHGEFRAPRSSLASERVVLLSFVERPIGWHGHKKNFCAREGREG